MAAATAWVSAGALQEILDWKFRTLQANAVKNCLWISGPYHVVEEGRSRLQHLYKNNFQFISIYLRFGLGVKF